MDISNIFNWQKILWSIEDSISKILLKVVLIIFSFLQGFSIFKIIDIFTPVHVGFLNIISSLFQTIQFSIVTTKVEYLIHLIFDIICLIVIGFGTLVFTEILIVNTCGLNYNIRSGFLLKEKLDNISRDCTILTNEIFELENFEENENNEIMNINKNTLINEDNNEM